jgi:hypothetical protein
MVTSPQSPALQAVQAALPATPDTISVVGGLFTPEWLARVAALQAPQQTDADYGVRAGFTLREEIGLAWRSAQALWRQFDQVRMQPGHDAWGVSRRFVIELARQCFGLPLVPQAHSLQQAGQSWPVAAVAHGGRVPLFVSPHHEPKPLDSTHEGLGDSASGKVRRRSAFAALQELLNARGDSLWGLAANGLVLRLARDNSSLTRPAWLQVDLECLFTEERYADFSLLWLLLHGSRFGPEGHPAAESPLEHWRNACREQGTRAREVLRGGVERALLALGQGFLSHPANTALRAALAQGDLTPDGLLRELLRLVYRKIFVLTVEERGLLHPPDAHPDALALYAEGYGLTRLRDRAIRRNAHDRHGDLWLGLRQVWTALEAGEPRLALPSLGGLFESGQCPHLDAAHLHNRHLLAALFHLCWMRETPQAPLARTNWRDMDSEELGSVYESLLELVPLVEDDHRRFSFRTGGETRGNARKTSGSYYTPDALVQQLLDSALEPVVQQALAAQPEGEAAAQALLSITVLDPACGSGHFLLAAARRLAAHLARIRARQRDPSGGQPSPDDYRHALREVVTHCVYGTDLNPMALELARMALWLEACTPDAPLGFVDHHFVLGNALLGVLDLKALLEGIPDEAYAVLTLDGKPTCSALKKANKDERERLARLVRDRAPGLDLGPRFEALVEPFTALEALPDDTPAQVAAKRARWEKLQAGQGADGAAVQRARLQLACDLWTAAFLAPKPDGASVPTTQHVVNALLGQPVNAEVLRTARDVVEAERALHWPLAFAPVLAAGGFRVVLGNPPWDQSQFNDVEFFASRMSELAGLPGDSRKKAIAKLEREEPTLWSEAQCARRRIEAQNSFFRGCPRFALTATGKLNSYPLFAETGLRLRRDDGRTGLVLPTGIATDDSTSAFFGAISQGGLAELVDFENRQNLFPAVDSRLKFCLLTMGAADRTRFAFFLTATDQLADPRRSFTLSADAIAKLNPNTLTCPVFRSQRDAEITKAIYDRVPVLWNEREPDGNPWRISFRQGLFNMTSESGLFRAAARRRELREPVPLYEAKMVHQYDHRWATYTGDESEDCDDVRKADPAFSVQPRYWVERDEVLQRLAEKGWSRQWLLGFRDITNATNERTVIAHVIPLVGVGNQFPLLFAAATTQQIAALIGCLSSLVLDYHARHKVGGTHLNFFIAKQLAVLPPGSFSREDFAFIVPRVLELTYTAHDLRPFYDDLIAEDPSCDLRPPAERGSPFAWDPDRRAELRAELDAWYARLYGLTRDELVFVLDPEEAMGAGYPSETFRVLKTNEIKRHGRYRTRDLVLAAWDAQESTHALARGMTTMTEG